MVSNSIQSSSRFVRLNIYYLTPYRSLHTIFNVMTLGLFTPYHSAIEIDGSEYAYYGHPFHFSGVMFGTPNKGAMMLAYTKIYGHTVLSNMDIEAKAHSLAFIGINYSLLHFNCNSFANAFLYALTKHHLPGWVNRPERCLRRIRWMHRLFSENEDISARIVSALYIKSAGDQVAVFNLLGIANDQRLTTIYEVMIQDCISCGKIPNFERLRQLSDPQIKDRLIYIHNCFLSIFPTKQSITLNKIFDDLSAIQRQLNRLERKLQNSSPDELNKTDSNVPNQKLLLPINTRLHMSLKTNEQSFTTFPSQENNTLKSIKNSSTIIMNKIEQEKF